MTGLITDWSEFTPTTCYDRMGRDWFKIAALEYIRKWGFGEDRPFIAWDGEGINLDGEDKPQSYCLFGCSTGRYITSTQSPGLGTRECFELLIRVAAENPGAIHVGFSTAYDVEMMLKDVPHDIIAELHEGSYSMVWQGFKFSYRKSKTFSLAGWYGGNGTMFGGKRVSMTLYDVWSFFGSSFVAAIKKFLPDLDPDVLQRIVDGKKQRGNFTVDQMTTVMIPYWLDELDTLVQLQTQLRTLMSRAGLFPRTWHGPGAIAAYLNKHHHIGKAMDRCPNMVRDAAQSAYAAGRVENYMIGRLGRRCYKYDRRSAYPASMRFLPSLRGRAWDFARIPEHDFCDPASIGVQSFGLYEVEVWDNPKYYGELKGYRMPQPLFHRNKFGHVTFPYRSKRWCWGVELLAINPETHFIHITQGLVLSNWEDTTYPFNPWVEDMFNTRMKMKEQKLAEQMALKLGLNSLYGKMAQQRGWREGQAIPTWHQLEWAGYVTAHNRAEMYKAAELAADRGILISCETDAIMTSAPMPELDTEAGTIGTWELETFDDVVYLQSGVYMTLTGDEWNLKYRGFDGDSLKPQDVLDYLADTPWTSNDPQHYVNHPLKVKTTRFMGSKLAATRTGGMENEWRTWHTAPKDVVIGFSEKRLHDPQWCRACRAGHTTGATAMHDMTLVWTQEPDEVQSYAMTLPWRTVDFEASYDELEQITFENDGIDEG